MATLWKKEMQNIVTHIFSGKSGDVILFILLCPLGRKRGSNMVVKLPQRKKKVATPKTPTPTTSDDDMEPPVAKGRCNKATCNKEFQEGDVSFQCPLCPRKYHRCCLPQYVLDQLDTSGDDPTDYFIDCDLCNSK